MANERMSLTSIFGYLMRWGTLDEAHMNYLVENVDVGNAESVAWTLIQCGDGGYEALMSLRNNSPDKEVRSCAGAALALQAPPASEQDDLRQQYPGVDERQLELVFRDSPFDAENVLMKVKSSRYSRSKTPAYASAVV